MNDPARETRDRLHALADEWYRHTMDGMDVLASAVLDEIAEVIEEARA